MCIELLTELLTANIHTMHVSSDMINVIQPYNKTRQTLEFINDYIHINAF